MSFTLRPLSDINALINGADYASLAYSRKYQLAGQAEAAALELDIVIPVLIALANSVLEEQFLRALVIVSSSGGGTPPTANGPYLIIPMVFQGTLANSQIFGWFYVPANLDVLSIQLTLQQPDPDANVTVQLVDNYGNPFADGNWPTLSAGNPFQNSTLNTPLPLVATQLVRAMITNYTPGSDGPKGAGLTCILIARLV